MEVKKKLERIIRLQSAMAKKAFLLKNTTNNKNTTEKIRTGKKE